MGKIYDLIDEKLARWLEAQKIFFVATAPFSPNGHINCSPKDGASFRILDEQTVAYLDLTGSGVKTIAHLKENGRYEFRGESSQLKEWAERKGEDSLAVYRQTKNSSSIDGLPGAT